ncbi:hypothetical protein BS78_02G249700 [Paspalum vaginatum]|nr:hypothetical protein BS78_02G249700 [Paspalum vaginatum]
MLEATARPLSRSHLFLSTTGLQLYASSFPLAFLAGLEKHWSDAEHKANGPGDGVAFFPGNAHRLRILTDEHRTQKRLVDRLIASSRMASWRGKQRKLDKSSGQNFAARFDSVIPATSKQSGIMNNGRRRGSLETVPCSCRRNIRSIGSSPGITPFPEE